MSPTPTQEFREAFPIPFVIRKSQALLMLRVFGALLLLEILYILLRLIAGSNDIGLEADSVWLFLAFAVTQLVVFGWLMLYWYNETYSIHNDDVHHNKGILFRNEKTYPFNNIQTITCHQSPLGRIYHYGDVRFFIPTLGEELIFKEVPHPHHFIHTIRSVMPYPDKAKFILHG